MRVCLSVTVCLRVCDVYVCELQMCMCFCVCVFLCVCGWVFVCGCVLAYGHIRPDHTLINSTLLTLSDRGITPGEHSSENDGKKHDSSTSHCYKMFSSEKENEKKKQTH